MKRTLILASLAILAWIIPPTVHAEDTAGKSERPWGKSFSPDKADLVAIGKNPYFVLLPTYRLHLEHGKHSMVISVLVETKMVDGVETRVVEEREMKDGKLVEVSRNYLAISKTTGDVYYFGEDVDTYENGKVTGHAGSWLAGVNGAKFGLWMPGRPRVGDKYYHELAPGTAMDRAEIVSLTDTCETPTGTYEKCLRTRETSGLDGSSEEKIYALDVGLIKDGNLVLVNVFCPPKGTIVP
ncbi:MAG: hypothetical protein HZC54_01295 [Verrucomicrobia bacterium]|nr:hypothetical protein [Verrucomicrobiota bacterium]